MSYDLVIPHTLRPKLSVHEIETAIKNIKDFFETNLAVALNLTRVSAPLFVKAGTGINDDLNGVEQPVQFRVKEADDADVQRVIIESCG
jgi:aspartate--ammonia ligase